MLDPMIQEYLKDMDKQEAAIPSTNVQEDSLTNLSSRERIRKKNDHLKQEQDARRVRVYWKR